MSDKDLVSWLVIYLMEHGVLKQADALVMAKEIMTKARGHYESCDQIQRRQRGD